MNKLTPLAPMLVALLAGTPCGVAIEPPAAPPADQSASPPVSHDTSAPTTPVPKPAVAVDLDTFLASAVTRVGLIDLLSHGSPGPGDMKIASIILGFAEELTPDDAQIVRWRVQLANTGEDRDMLEQKLRRLLELDPKDTALQLKLINTRVQKIQVAEDRIRAYERILAESASKLDATVRSYLALELAALYHNQGDREKCAEKIKLATSLASTNKEAAAFALSFYSEKVDDAMGRLELLTNLLYADPIDANTLTEMCHEFAGGGAFKEARRFQQLSDNVRARARQQQDTTRLMEDLALSWCSQGPTVVVDRMNKALQQRRNEAEGLIKEYEAAKLPTVGLILPEQVRLDPTLDRIRLIAARAAGDTVTADLAAADLRASYEQTIRDLTQPESGVVQNPEEVTKIVLSLSIELASALGWSGSQTERVRTDLDAMAEVPGFDANDGGYREARAWNTLRAGDVPKAIELFSSLVNESVSAQIGLATAYEAGKRTDDAITEYRDICRTEPLTAEACWAYTRVKELTRQEDFDPTLAARMREFATTIPSWLDAMTKDPNSFMALSATIVNESPAPFERLLMRVKLTNLAQIPLALGPGQTLDSRIMLSPSVQFRTESVRSGLLPDILDIGRRLRLMPRESVEVLFWPESGGVGWLAETYLREAVRIRWRLLQGFIRGQRGGMEEGPMALSASTPTVIRPPLPEAQLPFPQLIEKIKSAPESEIPALATAARAQLYAQKSTFRAPKPVPTDPTQPQQAPRTNPLDPPTDDLLLSPEDRAVLATALLNRYKASGPKIRALLLACLPGANRIAEMQAFDNVAAEETDPLCRCIFLITRITKATDSALSAGATSSDPKVSEIARLHIERLSNPTSADTAPGELAQPAPRPVLPAPKAPAPSPSAVPTSPQEPGTPK